MAASQHDVVNEVREAILQTFMALSRSAAEFDMNEESNLYWKAAMRLNRKWERHDEVSLIEV